MRVEPAFGSDHRMSFVEREVRWGEAKRAYVALVDALDPLDG